MSVFRVNKTKDYTVISNYHFKDKTLSLKAKGLLSQMLSLPDDWDYTVAGLCSINKESKSAIQAALKELEEAGYLFRTRTQNELGQFDYVYDIYEKPRRGEPRTEKPCTENRPQLNTNDKILKDKVNKERVSASRFSRPSLEQVRSYCEERDNRVDPEHFIDYYEANGWKVGKNPMKDWKAAVRNWEKRENPASRKKEKDVSGEWWANL